MSFKDIRDLASGASKSKDWYRSQVRYELEPIGRPLQAGDIIFYDYVAQSANLDWYDMHPLTYVREIDSFLQQFNGGNIHYLRPSIRQAVGKSFASGGTTYPAKCHHKYFMSNATNIKVVPREEFIDMVPLPVEKFYTSVGSRWIDIPSSFIWSKL